MVNDSVNSWDRKWLDPMHRMEIDAWLPHGLWNELLNVWREKWRCQHIMGWEMTWCINGFEDDFDRGRIVLFHRWRHNYLNWYQGAGLSWLMYTSVIVFVYVQGQDGLDRWLGLRFSFFVFFVLAKVLDHDYLGWWIGACLGWSIHRVSVSLGLYKAARLSWYTCEGDMVLFNGYEWDYVDL